MPFVPTPAAIFSAGGGVVIQRTFSARAGAKELESTAHFSTGCIVIGGTVWREAAFIQVVIGRTFPGDRGWNISHSLRWAGLLSAAQFLCGAGRRAKNIGCYPAHNSDFFRRRAGCYPQHNLRGGEKIAIVIGGTIRIWGGFSGGSKAGCYPAHISKSGVVIGRTISNL